MIIDVSFGETFSAAPNVVASVRAASSWGVSTYFVIVYIVDGSVTTTGCQVRVVSNYGSTRTGYIEWMAVGT